jgi:hypothetical protein
MPNPEADKRIRPSPSNSESQTHGTGNRKRRKRSDFSWKPQHKPTGWPAYLTLILLTTVCYFPIFQSGLIWLDYDQEQRSAYQSMDGLADAWTIESIRTGDPLTLSSYFLEDRLPFPDGQTHHAINLLLHIAAACIFLKVLEALKLPAAFSAALVFALHPAVMQTIFWSGYREELVGLILILASLFFGIRNRSPGDYAALLILSASACLLHPAALVLPLLLALCVIHQNRFPHLKDFNHVLPIVCLALFIGVWTQSGSTPLDEGLADRINRSSQNFFFYLRQAILPTDLALFHPPRISAEFTAGARYTFLPIFLLIPFYVLILFNYNKPWARSVFVGLTAYLLISIYSLLGSGTFLDGQSAQEDHFHYVSLPFILALAVSTLGGIIGRLEPGGRLLWRFGITIFILFQSTVAITQSLAIGDRASMWLEMSEQWPKTWVPKLALIETLQTDEDSGDLLTKVELINMLEAIIQLKPDSESARISLARAYRADSQNAQALRHYRWLARQEQPNKALMVEIADFYEILGMGWDAQTTRYRIEELYSEDKTN